MINLNNAIIYIYNLQTKLNRKFMRIESKDDFFVKPLSDEMAIEKV